MENKQLYKQGKLIYISNGKYTGVFYCNKEGKLCRFMWEKWKEYFSLNKDGYIKGDALYVHLQLGYKLGLYSGGAYPEYQEIKF